MCVLVYMWVCVGLIDGGSIRNLGVTFLMPLSALQQLDAYRLFIFVASPDAYRSILCTHKEMK